MTTATRNPAPVAAALRAGAGTRRRLTNRAMTGLFTLAFLAAVTPLALVLVFTVARGAHRLDATFFTHSMAGVAASDPGGGAYAAIVGTVEQVALTAAMAVPLGIAAAVYLVEYGRGALAGAVRFFVDVMTGIPSIVAGLFVFAFWVLALGRGFSGFGGALALGVLMLPVVVRSTEEMLRLVPRDLREASFALGVPRWRTIASVVLPTAASGITTGVMLAVARVTGETAPLLLTVFGNSYIHLDPFHGLQDALPLFVFKQAGQAYQPAIDRAWTGALTLIVIVMALYVGARLLTRRGALSARR
jgi:phosphate transport system permease protein